MSLFEIITALQLASGSKAKQAILEQHKDNELLKAYLLATYDPALSYYQKAVPKHGTPTGRQASFDMSDINHAIEAFAKRRVTGDLAKRAMKKWLEDQNSVEDQALCTMLIARSIGAGIGETLVLKTFPGLFFTVPYQRCSLLDDKAKAKFGKLSEYCIEEKCDGSFLYLVKEQGKAPQAITRAGSCYPLDFTEALAEGVPDGVVLIGELLVFTNPQYDGKMDVLDRQTGNGMLNSILKGGDVDNNFVYKMFAWDVVSVAEFKAGKSVLRYNERRNVLKGIASTNTIPNVQAVYSERITSMEQAYRIYSQFTAAGKEGAVLKTTDFLWSDGTSKDCCKMKVAFEVDLEIIGMKEGTGKAAGMLGALSVQSSDGLLQCDVGTGYSDQVRKEYWQQREELLGMIVAVKANDILANRANEKMSLFLPVHLELRLDKKNADSYDECLAILNSAKGIV